MDLLTPIREAGLTYRLKALKLEKLGIFTLSDLINYIPFRYEDYTNNVNIRDLKIDQLSVIKGTMLELKNEYTRRHFVLQKGIIQDTTGQVSCVWFNQTYITRVIKPGDTVALVGKLEFSGRTRTFQVKDYEAITDDTQSIHTQGLVPVYSETKGLSSKWLRNRIFDLLKSDLGIEEYLPSDVITTHTLEPLTTAYWKIHFPKEIAQSQKARERLAFNELYLAQLGALKRREEWEEKRLSTPFELNKKAIKSFISSLPFTLTQSQQKAIDEILNDTKKSVPMNRLLQGDVGSGKTIVSAVAMYVAHLNGMQSVLMAPTEILANQHYETVKKLFEPLDVSVGLLTGSKKTVDSTNPPNILIGTHALLHKAANFEKLGLVVIDEQQRFGVKQRSLLREKGTNPHFLTMTATPIPRTALLVLYKDLELSVLSDMPKGRKQIKTWLVPPYKRDNAYKWIKEQIIKSNYEDQVFIVCPFIEESENAATVKAATVEFEHLSKKEFKGLKVGLLHGKMKIREKDEILQQFKDKKLQVLIATPVVEVGIDIPNATIMVIEAAERFGLSQLHQLRGRVGRNDRAAYCLLFSDSENEQVLERLKAMETAHSGFELAELDLKLRGPGDMYGTMQHGAAGFKVANFSDFELVDKTRESAERTIKNLQDHPKLLEKITSIQISTISPD